jgi:hypothetical protein
LRDDTEYWLAQNYPGIFSDVHYGVRDKGALAAKLGAVKLIDNDLTHYRSMEKQGIEAVWFAPYWWNRFGRKGSRKLAISWWAIKEILLENSAC